jgi:hypothetical protein
MGKDAKIKTDRHRTKLFNGRTDAVSLWRKTVLMGMPCSSCKTAPAIGTINMFWPGADFEKDQPALAVKYASECAGSIPIVKFKVCGEVRNFVAMPVLYFCGACRKEMEVWAAHAPSYVVSEVRTGPHPDHIIGQVTKKLVA